MKYIPGVPAGNVSGVTTNLLRATGILINLGKLLRTRVKVGVPAKPTTMTSVDVHDDVGKVKALKSVRDTLLISAFTLLASAQVGVGDQVGKRVGLDEKSEG